MRNLKQGQEVSRSFLSYISRYCLSRLARYKTDKVWETKMRCCVHAGRLQRLRFTRCRRYIRSYLAAPQLSATWRVVFTLDCRSHIWSGLMPCLIKCVCRDQTTRSTPCCSQHWPPLNRDHTGLSVDNHHPVQWAAFDKPASSINHLILQHFHDNVLRCGTIGRSRKCKWSFGCQTCLDYNIWETQNELV
jgi:hypothetical protein